MAPFHGRGSTASRLEPLRGGSLLFTTKFPEISGTLLYIFSGKICAIQYSLIMPLRKCHRSASSKR